MKYTYIGKCMSCPFCSAEGICDAIDYKIPNAVGWSWNTIYGGGDKYQVHRQTDAVNAVPWWCELLRCHLDGGHVMGFKLSSVIDRHQSRNHCELVYLGLKWARFVHISDYIARQRYTHIHRTLPNGDTVWLKWRTDNHVYNAWC